LSAGVPEIAHYRAVIESMMLGILSVLLREYDWASFTMDPSGASIVKISARTVNPSIPDVEWFNCGYRVATIHMIKS
jgi:hypothetical protein